MSIRIVHGNIQDFRLMSPDNEIFVFGTYFNDRRMIFPGSHTFNFGKF